MNRKLVDMIERIALTLSLIGGVLIIVYHWL
jgi:hypothetical protein